MRARGAEVTDIVVLVVAADDGVMPQTIEAIDHARAADVPIIVAVNKIDREEADPNRVLQQLSEYGLVPEAWGGDTITVEVSALQNLGIDDLLEQIVLVAEVEELVASPEGRARGVVIEAELEIGRGPVASVIVERGTLRVGDPIVAGAAWGKVKALVDDHGDQIKEAPPSTPVQVLGFSEPPDAGDEFRVAPELAQARTIGEARAHRYRVAGHVPAATSALGGAKLEDLFEQIQRGETATLNLILKADVRGSLEAVTESLRKLERDDVKLSFVHRGVGGITEYDVELAQASKATIIGFNVRPDRRAREMAAEGQGRDPDLRDHLQAARGPRGGHARPAGAGLRGDRHRRGRGAPGLPGSPDRGHRRLLRPRGRRSPAARRSASSGRAWSSGRAPSPRCAGSRTTPVRCRPGSSAASGSRTTRT